MGQNSSKLARLVLCPASYWRLWFELDANWNNSKTKTGHASWRLPPIPRSIWLCQWFGNEKNDGFIWRSKVSRRFCMLGHYSPSFAHSWRTYQPLGRWNCSCPGRSASGLWGWSRSCFSRRKELILNFFFSVEIQRTGHDRAKDWLALLVRKFGIVAIKLWSALKVALRPIDKLLCLILSSRVSTSIRSNWMISRIIKSSKVPSSCFTLSECFTL